MAVTKDMKLHLKPNCPFRRGQFPLPPPPTSRGPTPLIQVQHSHHCVHISNKHLAGGLEEADGPKPTVVVKPSSLNKATQKLLLLIFNSDMFKETMRDMEIGE